MLTLRIDHTWDGGTVSEEEVVVVGLGVTPRGLRLTVDAPLQGDPPPEAPPGPTEGLWEHEVVEVFLAGSPEADGAVPYTEIELGPYGHHLVLRLRGVRRVEARLLPLALSVTREAGRWRAEAHLDGALLPPGPWRANAYAIHGRGAARRYLAWQPVPGLHPDFHQPDRFVALSL